MNSTFKFHSKNLSYKGNSTNTISKFFNKNEETVTKVSFFDPLSNHSENLFNLKKNERLDQNKDLEESKLTFHNRLKSVMLPKISEMLHNKKNELNVMQNVRSENELRVKRKTLEEKLSDLRSDRDRCVDLIGRTNKEIESIKLDLEFLEKLEEYVGEDNLKRRVEESVFSTKKRKLDLSNPSRMKEIDFEEQMIRNRSKLNQIVNKRGQEINEKKENLKKKIESREKIKENLENAEKNIRILNGEIDQITNSLLCYYHNILQEGREIRKEGLVWIIKAIWNLGYNVIISFLPSFLDEKSLKYLFKYAKIDIEREKIKRDIDEFKNKIRFYAQKKIKRESKLIFQTENQNDLLYMGKNLSRNNKSLFGVEAKQNLSFKSIKKSVEQKFEFNDTSKIHLKTIKDLEDSLYKKKMEMDELREKEITRINKEFLVNNYERRFKIDHKTLIAALVGENIATRENTERLREQRDYLHKVSICRTFNIVNPVNNIKPSPNATVSSKFPFNTFSALNTK